MNTIDRIQNLVRLFEVPKDKTIRFAFKYLFSMLSAVEQIAVLAAERGAGVEGQLEDEIVHRDAFKQLAINCGGFEGACEKTQELIDYLENLHGEKSMAALNVVAEGWLGCVFKRVAHLCPDLFNSVGEDEARHNGYALSYKIPDSHELEPIIKDLEFLLLEVATSPNFILPMIYLVGLKEVGQMGLEIQQSHIKACNHLNVEHSTKQYELTCRRSIKGSTNLPDLVPMNTWQINKHRIWNSPHEMVIQKEILIDTANELKAQAKIIEALYKVLSIEPRFRNVTRDNKIYRTKRFIIGVRTSWDEEQLTTVYVDAKNSYKDILKSLITKTKRIRSKPYEEIPDVYHIKELLLPSQCPVTLSFIGNYGTEWGFTRLSEVEGVATSIFIGSPTDYKYPITLVMDHRVFDGKDIQLFGHLLKKYLEKGKY